MKEAQRKKEQVRVHWHQTITIDKNYKPMIETAIS